MRSFPEPDDPEAASRPTPLQDGQIETRQTDKAEQSDLMRQRTQLFPLLELQTPNNMDTHTYTELVAPAAPSLPASY